MYVPQLGDIGLVKIQGCVGTGIRIGQWLNGDGFEDFEHAFVVTFHDGLVEAMPDGARNVGLDRYDGQTVRYLRCPEKYQDQVARAALHLVGTPYSFLDYASLALHRFHVPAPHLRAYIRSTGHMICSQLADEAAKRGGWHLFDDGRWSGDVTPGDLNGLWREQHISDIDKHL
jgi:hypothetical protein